MQDRIYDANGIAICIASGFNPWYLIKMKTIDAQCYEEPHGWNKGIVSNNDMCQSVRATHMQKIILKENIMENENLRIRKLTACECFRLMSYCPMNEDRTFDDEMYKRARQVASESMCYKVAGNGIVVNTLSAILKELL